MPQITNPKDSLDDMNREKRDSQDMWKANATLRVYVCVRIPEKYSNKIRMKK